MISDNVKNQLIPLLEDLIPQLNKLTIEYMTKSGIKTSSNLTKSVGYEVDDNTINLLANNYWYYASQGRSAGTKKVPITALIDYIKRYGITPTGTQTITQLAFAIQTAIYKQGINPKSYVDKVIDGAGEFTQETLANEIAEYVADEVVKVMTETPYGKEV